MKRIILIILCLSFVVPLGAQQVQRLIQFSDITFALGYTPAPVQINPGNLFISTGGNDANTCLNGSPCLTLQHAITVAYSQYDLKGSDLTINIGAGSFAGAQINGIPKNSGNGGRVKLLGAGSVNTTISSTIVAAFGANIEIGSMTITSGSGSDLLIENNSAVNYIDGDLNLGAAPTALVDCFESSIFIGNSGLSLTISGGATYGFLLSSLSQAILSANATVTLTGTPTFSTAFVDAINNSLFDPGINSTFSGSATGLSYAIATNSVIDMENVTTLPGTGAGTATYNSSYFNTNSQTITQTGSRTTGVTLNNRSGQITMVTAAGSTTPQSFVVTNNLVLSTDTIIVNMKSGASNTYNLQVTFVATGNFTITFWTSGGTASDTPVISYKIVSTL